jgi:polysaccharide deacetylase family protein (PEP-CTERM system associated)
MPNGEEIPSGSTLTKADRNAISIDVEEYFQVEAFSDLVQKKDWDKYSHRTEGQTQKILELLATFQVSGTFFVLGWLAERNPTLVRKIHDAGHEVASHGFEHKMISNMTPAEFREDIRKSKHILEGITNSEIHGYRAPTFSIVEKTKWAYEILLEEGFRYSSSVYPIWHDRYGWPEFGQEPRSMAANGNGEIWEIPMAVWSIGPFRIPFGGGGYLRLYPLFLTKVLFRSQLEKGKPSILYMHPWELDADQPRINAPFLRHLRHYAGIRNMENKLVRLLQSLEFGTVRQYMEERIAAGNALPRANE